MSETKQFFLEQLHATSRPVAALKQQAFCYICMGPPGMSVTIALY